MREPSPVTSADIIEGQSTSMKHLTSIVALNSAGAIGCQNQLPWRLKTDLNFFRKVTINHIVIMGRKTYDSIGQPLPGRFNIVVSHNGLLFEETDISKVVTSVDEAFFVASKVRSFNKSQVFVIGGEQTYALFAPFVDRYIFTLVDKDVPHADAFFDESLLGFRDDWKEKPIKDVLPDPIKDDANFQIYQYDFVDLAQRVADREARTKYYQMKIANQPQSRLRMQLVPFGNLASVNAS